jgi:hypothetical protein
MSAGEFFYQTKKSLGLHTLKCAVMLNVLLSVPYIDMAVFFFATNSFIIELTFIHDFCAS